MEATYPKLLEKINTSKFTTYSFFLDHIGVNSSPPNPYLVVHKYLTKEERSLNC
jgi:hypothetical protein